eukprot:6626628-Alexandrium_andersonii.AAC.1
MSEEQLRRAVVGLSLKLRASQKEKEKWRMRAFRSERQIRKLKRSVELAAEERALRTYVKDGKRRKGAGPRKLFRMTAHGIYRLGLKQTMGYGGANSTKSILGIPVGDKQVVRCEQLLCANVFCQARAWFTSMCAALTAYVRALHQHGQAVEGGLQDLVSFEIHGLRGDATNTTTLNSCKVFASEVFSVFHVPALPVSVCGDGEHEAPRGAITCS